MATNAIPLWKAPSDADLLSFLQSKKVPASRCRELLRMYGILQSVNASAEDLYREIARLDINYERLQKIVATFSKTDDSRGKTVDETNLVPDIAKIYRAIDRLRKTDAAQCLALPPNYDITLFGRDIIIEIEHKKIEAERTALLCQVKETSRVVIKPTREGCTFTCDDSVSQGVADAIKECLDTIDGTSLRESYLSAEGLDANQTRLFFDLLTRLLEHPSGKNRTQALKDVTDVGFKNARDLGRDVKATSFQGTSGRARDLLRSEKVKEEVDQGYFVSSIEWTTTYAISPDSIEEWDYRAGFKTKAKRFEFRVIEKRVGSASDEPRRVIMTRDEIDFLEGIILRAGHSAFAQVKAAPRHA